VEGRLRRLASPLSLVAHAFLRAIARPGHFSIKHPPHTHAYLSPGNGGLALGSWADPRRPPAAVPFFLVCAGRFGDRGRGL
jgi:hypothetical protein